MTSQTEIGHGGLNPPDVSGEWDFTVCNLSERDITEKVEFSDIINVQARLTIEQQGFFVIIKNAPNPDRPQITIRLAIWHPVLVDGKISNWILYNSDGDDTQVSIYEIIRWQNSQPAILALNSYESGIDPQNPSQYQFATSGFGIKVDLELNQN